MKASERVAELEAEVADLQAIVMVLKGEAYAKVALKIKPLWANKLRRQELVLVGLLMGAYPRYVHSYDLLGGLPSNPKTQERDVKLVSVLACRVRKVLGHNAIVSDRSGNYALSEIGHSVVTLA